MWTGSSPLHICVAPRERSLACRAVRSLHLSRSRSPRPHPWNRQRATASAQHAGGHCVEAPCCSCCVVLEKEAVASWCSCCVVLEKEAMASLHNVPEVAQEAERRQRRRAPPSTCVLAPSASWPPFCATEIARDLTNANGNGHPVPATDTSLANASSPLRSAAGTSTPESRVSAAPSRVSIAGHLLLLLWTSGSSRQHASMWSAPTVAMSYGLSLMQLNSGRSRRPGVNQRDDAGLLQQISSCALEG